MSLVNFDDFLYICSHWNEVDVYEDGITGPLKKDHADPNASRPNRWWELAENEILNEKRDEVLV